MGNGILSSNQDMIADCITQFYMNLYTEQQVDQPFPNVLEFPRISRAKADWLERPFKETKISEVIKDFNSDKSLVPDDFPVAISQSCHKVLKSALLAMPHFYGQFEKSLNATFIPLIPKKKKNTAKVEVKDFSPINLVGGFIKFSLKFWLQDYARS